MENSKIGLVKWWANQPYDQKLWFLVGGIIATSITVIFKLVSSNAVLHTKIEIISEKFRTAEVNCERAAFKKVQEQRDRDDSIIFNLAAQHIADVKACEEGKAAIYLNRNPVIKQRTEIIKSVLK